MSSWTNLPPFQVQQLTSVSRFDQFLENIEVLAPHTHGGGAGDGNSRLGINARGTRALESTGGMEVSVFPFLPASQGNWDRITPCPVHLNGGIMKTNSGVSASGASIAWPVLISGCAPTAGWIISFGYYADGNSGCAAASFNGSPVNFSSVSTFSMYSAAAASGTVFSNTITNASINNASGVYVIRMQIVGKSTCSAGYDGGVNSINVTYV